MDARPNDHARPALAHDLPDHVGNVDQFPPAVLSARSQEWVTYPYGSTAHALVLKSQVRLRRLS